MRVALFLGIALLLFLPFNWIAYRQLTRLHPRRKRFVVAAIVLGNLMWPFFPLLRSSTGFGRAMRAVLGPLWFGWSSFAILYSLLLLVLLLAWLPFMRRADFARFAPPASRVFLWLTIVGTIAGFYHALVPLRVERVPVTIANLPASANGMKIALLSDLHVGLFTRMSRLERIFSTTAAERPDVVLLAGDLIDDDPYFVPKLLAGTRTLPQSIPLLAVLGNHEMYGDPHRVIQLMNGSRIRLLVNEGFTHGPLWIAGVSDYAANREAPDLKPDLDATLRGMPANALPVVLSHQPKAFDDAIPRGVPLTVAGHTHGGQCGIRRLGISLAGVFLERHMGLYREGNAQLYINTGTGYWLVPFRLGMTPEITIIELRAAV